MSNFINTPIIFRRKKYDNSSKSYEILFKEYRYHKYERKLINQPSWTHYKYYDKLEYAEQALKDIRNSWFNKIYYDYPAMGNIENEKKFSHITPTITITRYCIQKCNILK